MFSFDDTMPMDLQECSSKVSDGVRVSPRYLYLEAIEREVLFSARGGLVLSLWVPEEVPRIMTWVLLALMDSLLLKNQFERLSRSF